MHLEKLLLIGSTECGLASFRSGWIGSNNFLSQAAAYPQNSIAGPDARIISTEQFPGIEPSQSYDDDFSSKDVQPIPEVGPWSIRGPRVGHPIEVGQPIKPLPEITPTRNYDDDFASEDVEPMIEVAPWTIHGPRVGQPIHDYNLPSEDVQPVAGIMPIRDEFGQGIAVPMIVHDFESPRSTPASVSKPEIAFECEYNEYEITIAMGSDLWSGTDDEVEIRLYFLDGSVSEWFDLRIPMYNAFERLSIDSFCVRPQQGTLQKPSFIGLRKFGRDQMKIEAVMVSTNFSSSIFNVGQWIRTSDEFLFYSSEFD